MSRRDLSLHRIITAQDVEDAARAGVVELLLQPGAMLTPEAAEAVARHGLRLCGREKGDGWEQLLNSAEAQPFKEEICAVGRKLWQRMYVDGNGGNISYRLREDAVLCTPTLCSKADLTPADLCLVDLEGKQLAGGRARTSEILLHLEIYKAVPEARAVVHCHPPHATAYAITGRVPPTCIIPEYEVFIGKVALSPYETPGTKQFAETVLPFVKTHNTVLLANHGIVCWADTVTHAEWYAEVVDTYCWTLMLAQQLGAPLEHIPAEKAGDLLKIKQRLGLPDARLSGDGCPVCDLPEKPGAVTTLPNSDRPRRSSAETVALIEAVTEAVLRALEERAKR